MSYLDFRVQRIEERMGQRLPDRFYASKLSFDSLSLEASGTYTCVKHYEFDCANSLTLCPANYSASYNMSALGNTLIH